MERAHAAHILFNALPAELNNPLLPKAADHLLKALKDATPKSQSSEITHALEDGYSALTRKVREEASKALENRSSPKPRFAR